MPLTEVQRYNMEQYLSDPTGWTDKAAREICVLIKDRLVELEHGQRPQGVNIFVRDLLADMRDEGKAFARWADKLEEAMRNGE